MEEQLQQLIQYSKVKKIGSNLKRWNKDLYEFLIAKTNFLQPNATVPQRLWHLEHNIQEQGKCKICGKLTSWNYKTKQYREFCSSTCSSKDNDVLKKREQTNLQKYGVNIFVKAPNFNEKRIQTNIEKYGVPWATQTYEVQQKRKQTNLQKYGAEEFTQTKIYRQKTSLSVKAKYNVDYISQTRISLESLQKLKDKSWLEYQHHQLQKPVSIIAEELNVDTTTVVSYCKLLDIELHRFSNSFWKKELLEELQKYTSFKILSNDRTLLNGKELDIYIPEAKLAIELCGLYWHSDVHDRITKNYHHEKYQKCREKGVRLITIFEDEWLNKKQIVLNILKYKLNAFLNEQHVFARKCEIIQLTTKQKRDFFEKTHIQGNGPGSISYGLTSQGELVAAMSFIRRNNNVFILNRFSTDGIVVGGFSKLLSHFIKNHEPIKIETFADLRWSDGDLYLNNGFRLVKYLKPDYFYIKNQQRKHKFGFRHKLLKNKLKIYDKNKTEVENCKNNGWFRVWDCGKLKFERKF